MIVNRQVLLLYVTLFLSSFEAVAMDYKSALQDTDILALILRYVIAGQRYSNNLLENSDHVLPTFAPQHDNSEFIDRMKYVLLSKINPNYIAEENRLKFIQHTKNVIYNIMAVNKTFYATTKNIMHAYEQIPHQVSAMIGAIETKYGCLTNSSDIAHSFHFEQYRKINGTMIAAMSLLLKLRGTSPTSHFLKDMVSYFETNKLLIDVYFKGLSVSKGFFSKNFIRTGIFDDQRWIGICFIPHDIALFYLQPLKESIIDNLIPKYLYVLFTECYDLEKNVHYHNTCLKIKSLLQEMFHYQQFKEKMIQFFDVMNTLEQEDNTLHFCPLLRLFIKEKYGLPKSNIILPNNAINESIVWNSSIDDIITNLPLINEYKEQKISFEKFVITALLSD